MKVEKETRRVRRPGSVCAGVVWLALLLAAAPVTCGQESAERVALTILATTDVHGNVWPYDYLQGQDAERGLAKVSAYVRQVRARQPNTLLVDCGDTFQGTPLAYLAAEKHAEEPNPVVAAMNAMGYDAMAIGNHEWNFGLHTLWRLKEEARFPILGANVASTYHDRLRDFKPYVIRRVGGVRVALLGLVTSSIPRWDPPEHLVGYKFRDPVEVARKLVPQLRRKADVVVVLIHSGLGRDAETGAPVENVYPEENHVWDLAEQVPGIDVIFFGHSHRELAGKVVNGALLVQPKNWARSVAEVELTLARDNQGWRVVDRQSRLVPMDASIPADPKILELTRAAHQQTERYLSTVVAELGEDLDARSGRIEDHALVELIHRAQLHATGAQVSLASLFSTRTRWAAGPVTLRDVYSLYFYENKLFTVEITGRQLKDALEYSARSFATYPWPEDATPFSGWGYNFDMAQGVTYKIDLSRPPGERIADLRFEGAALDPARKLMLALNSYRWSGGGGYEMLRHAKIVGRAKKQVRETIIDYLSSRLTVETNVDHNWEIVPADAHQALLDWLQSTTSISLRHVPAGIEKSSLTTTAAVP